MKLNEMAEFLRDFSSFMAKHSWKGGVADVQKLADSLAAYPDWTVNQFVERMAKLDQAPAARASRPKKTAPPPDELIAKINSYISGRGEYTYAHLDQFSSELAKLTAPVLKQVGEAVGCPLTYRSKGENLNRLTSWLRSMKMMDDHAATVHSTATPDWERDPSPALASS